jgi:hypothetical protein
VEVAGGGYTEATRSAKGATMRRMLLPLALLLILAAVPPARAQPAVSTIYLPIVARPALPFEVVVTAEIDSCAPPLGGCGYPSYYYLRGYVRNLTAAPLYGIVLEVAETTIPYDPDNPGSGGYTSAVRVTPVLTATLPGQINPFGYTLVLGKASGALGAVTPLSYGGDSPDGLAYYPLTVVGWARAADGTLSGTLRNDSGRSLTQLRAALFHSGVCEVQTAELSAASLAPGASAGFSAPYTCASGSYTIVGQGAAPPAP